MAVKIFIDPGHGGSDPGAVANGLREKDLTLAIAKECNRVLNEEYEGVQTKMSRTGDTYPSLSARTKAANDWGADYFVSIHINAGGGTGFESYIFNGTVSSKTKEYQKKVHQVIAAGDGWADRGSEVRDQLTWSLAGDESRIDLAALAGLPDAMRAEQRVFDRTGGLHAAALVDAAGKLVVIREDIGRHNAVDKVIGAALMQGQLPLTGHVLQVSGRASFELVQKAAAAAIPVLSAVSAPSSLAVDLADDCGLTLVGFVRSGGMNVYTHPERIRLGTDYQSPDGTQ